MDEKAYKICAKDNCDSKVRCKGLCNKHYSKKNNKENRAKQDAYDKSDKRRFQKLMNHCKNKTIPTDLTLESWLELIKGGKCYYCEGDLPKYGYGLDRKHPDIGYFKVNLLPCCSTCNMTKSNRFSHLEFKIMMDALLKVRKSLGL
jgi:hypothetical protein